MDDYGKQSKLVIKKLYHRVHVLFQTTYYYNLCTVNSLNSCETKAMFREKSRANNKRYRVIQMN